MNLIIVESPTKAKTLAKFLGDEYVVEATMGHVKDLPKSTLGVDVKNNFKPEYIEVEKRRETIDKLKAQSKKAKSIYLASDPDREGEAIASHVKDVLANSKFQIPDSKFKRITFHEITKEAVENALSTPATINQNLVNAQTARRVLDRLVGYNLSPLLWKKVRIGLSAGRVQSVAVRLIVEKEREIEKFKPEEYWEIFSNLKSRISKRKSEFTVQLAKVSDKTADIKNKSQADEILKDLKVEKYKVADIRKRDVVKSPYPPFTTSTLTQAGARIFGWSSKRTMSIAQKLYENGLITYHRTDSTNIAESALTKVRAFIEKKYGKDYLPEKSRFFKNKSKNAQEAHEAIRVTDVNCEPPAVDAVQEEKKLYELIWKRFVASQMSYAKYSETTIDVAAGKYLLRTGGQIMIFDGWTKLRLTAPAGQGEADDLNILPEVEKGEDLDLIKTWGDQKFTLPPARYNEASLIKTLEKLGIGRPSTYAPTISTIQIRQYVEKNENRQFVPTNVGIAVNDFLVDNFPDTLEYGFTAQMEDDLDKIAQGELKWVKVIKDFYDPFSKKTKDVEKNSKRVKIEVEKLGKKCPDCKDGELVVRTGRFGKFISCSKFPDCKHTEKYLEKVGVKCPDCKKGDVIVKKSGKGRKFFGCSNYPDCKYASWKSPKKEGDDNKNSSSVKQ